MKKIISIIFALGALGFLVFSCTKDTPKPSPTVTSISQNPISPGGSFTITGTNFDASAANNVLKFGTTAVNVSASTSTTLTATLPQNFTTGSYEVGVTVSGVTAKLASKVDVTPDAPSITSFSPTQSIAGGADSYITITGTNFSTTATENQVKFGTITATVTSATSTQLTVTVPTSLAPNSYPINITILQNGEISGTAISQILFTVVPQVLITSINPTSGPKNSSLTINGSNFDPTNNVVTINGMAAIVTAATATQLTVTVPQGAGTGVVSVQTNGQTANGPTFTYQLSRSYNVHTATTLSNDSKLAGVSSLAYDSVNNILYAGSATSSTMVVMNATNGSIINTMSTLYPYRLCYANGTLYGEGGTYVYKFNGSGASALATFGNTCVGLTYRNNKLYTAVNGSIISIDLANSNTQSVVLQNMPQSPLDLSMDVSGSNFYLSNNYSSIDKVDASTGAISHVLYEQNGTFFTVSTDLVNNLYISKYNSNGDVFLYDQTQNLQVPLAQFPSSAPYLDIVAVYKPGQIIAYVSDWGNASVHKIIIDVTLN